MRYIKQKIIGDLERKTVFLGGPRQVGKTTLAREISSSFSKFQPHYLNWDFEDDRTAILKAQFPLLPSLIVLDEVHKYRKWKNLVKGFCDKLSEKHKFIVTGSARLDVFQRGGDSLLGRYFYWRLHPFGLDDLPSGMSPQEGLQRLLKTGGFPEPFLGNNGHEDPRWHRLRTQKIIREDIRDLTLLNDFATMELFFKSLQLRCGGLIVLSNIAQDLQVAPKTLERWLETFERMYLTFSIKPFVTGVPRSLQKPSKVYFWNNADVVGDEGAVFENFVATQIIKKIHFAEDAFGEIYSLHYLRDKEKKEVDFLLFKDGKVDTLIEVKTSDKKASTSLKYFAEKLNPRSVIQVVKNLDHSFEENNIKIMNAVDLFSKIEVFV